MAENAANFLHPPLSESTVPRLRPHSCPALLALALALPLAACTGAGGRHSVSPEQAAWLQSGWIDDSPLEVSPAGEPERLAGLADAGVRGRVLRLDRLLDLYDGARFGADKAARDSLWQALGGYSSTQGIDASREVVLRLLEEAYAIEEQAAVGAHATESAEASAGTLSEDEQIFVADTIMLLSTDMFLPDSADTLITATLAYRLLAENGHPRIADNAHWRLYDHVRGVLEGATTISPDLRADVVVHALYAEREDISAWLADHGPHARPPLPSPRELWELLLRHRASIAALPRWQGVVARRATAEAELEQTVMALLPRPRDPSWRLPGLARGTGHPESLAPVVQLEPGVLRLEPGSESPREFAPQPATDEDAAAILAGFEGLLARDGRGTVLLVAPPDAPAPDYAKVLEGLAAARTQRIELAVHEPGLPRAGVDEDSPVVVVLPLYVARADDPSAGAAALRDSRIHIMLGGRGPRVRVDGRWLSVAPKLPSDLLRLVADLRRAYPRERSVSLSLAPNVQHQQVVDLLAALGGGLEPAFLAVGWLPDAAPVPEGALDEQVEARSDGAFEARSALHRAALQLERPAPGGLAADEWARLQQATDPLLDCVPELERPLPKGGVELRLSFAEGKLVESEASGKKLPRERLDAYAACARERLLGFGMREQRDPFVLELRVTAAD